MAQTLFGTPPTIDFPDNAEDTYSMATRVTFAVDGNIVGVRFWGTTNPLTTIPELAIYNTAGLLLYSQTFAGPLVTSAWNTQMLATPQSVGAGIARDIVVGPRDRYAGATATFAAPLVVGDLTGTAGRFIVSAASPPPFPTTSTTNWYGIDVLFEADISGTLNATLPALTSNLDGEVTASGQINAVIPALTSDIVGLVTVEGVLNAVLPAFTSDFTGTSAAGGNIVGPCSWSIPAPLCCPEWASFPVAVQSSAQDYAATILWAATGRQFGLCEMQVRPCGMRRCQDGLGEFWGYDWSGGTWTPYIFNGQWFNCLCPGICCCEPRCQVRLMGPVNSIVEVTIGGIAVDPATYRVDDNHWLVRTAGECWPICADLDTDDGPNVFVVTYMRGDPVPSTLLRAGSTLACEWAKGCTGGDCRLSNRVTTLARNGVTIDMVDPTSLLDQGLTGLWEVDTVIKAFNPQAGRVNERLRIYAPELNVPRTVTSP